MKNNIDIHAAEDKMINEMLNKDEKLSNKMRPMVYELGFLRA